MAAPPIDWRRRGDRTEITIPADAEGAPLEDALRALLAGEALAGSEVHLVADHPAGADRAGIDALVARLGFAPERTLDRMRRPLPLPADHPARGRAPSIETRAYRPGDAEAWVAVNNRSFAAHPDQGAETLETLAARLAEPTADPEGFLVLDDADHPGELAGFCWTKVAARQPAGATVGEIYVIGADPRHQGAGLGTALVLAGLDHLAAQGVTVAELYVESDNAPARALYDRLGFVVHDRRRVYGRVPS